MRILPFLCLFLTACTHLPSSMTPTRPSVVIPEQTRQLIVVISDHWDSTEGQLFSFEKNNRGWGIHPITGAVTLGKKGLAWGIGLHPEQPGRQKAEGDGRAPAGLFTLSGTFGYEPSVTTAMPYQAMLIDDFCIDVPHSPLYNLTVNRTLYPAKDTEGTTEPMRRDVHVNGDQSYQLGVFIDHNPTQVRAAGSCIFMHIWKSPTTATAGCTAMTPHQLQSLVKWLDPNKKPLYLLLPKQQYQQLQQSWQLPELPASI
jgi:L,D-peptidoglycan transpeptidase YkuD (ErfK/YbiS/YcfS/YnhG family)